MVVARFSYGMKNRKVASSTAAERCVQLYVTRFKLIRPSPSQLTPFSRQLFRFSLAPAVKKYWREHSREKKKGKSLPSFLLHFLISFFLTNGQCWNLDNKRILSVCVRAEPGTFDPLGLFFLPVFGLRRRETQKESQEREREGERRRRGRYT